jgi:hypothetical protein
LATSAAGSATPVPTGEDHVTHALELVARRRRLLVADEDRVAARGGGEVQVLLTRRQARAAERQRRVVPVLDPELDSLDQLRQQRDDDRTPSPAWTRRPAASGTSVSSCRRPVTTTARSKNGTLLSSDSDVAAIGATRGLIS